jgi:hypothetical protein
VTGPPPPPADAPPRRRRVLVVWALLTVLAAAAGVIELRDVIASRAARGPTVDPGLLVPAPAEELGALEIADAGTLHRFERDGAGAWFYHGVHTGSEGAHAHAADAAMAARIEQVVQAFARTRVERRLPPGTDARSLGLATPRVLVLVYRRGERQPLAQYAVGDLAADTLSRYVDAVGGAGIVTIPGYQIDNLVTLLDAARSVPAPR